jgi:monoamine oxidase
MLRYAAIAHNHESQWYTIRDGMEKLPQAFANRLDGAVDDRGKKVCETRYGSAVVEINQDPKSVTVTYENLKTGQRNQETGDYVICAIPLTTLRNIKVQPHFRPGKEKAIREITYCSVCRVYLQCNKRVWNPEHNESLREAGKKSGIDFLQNNIKEKGVVYTDLPIMNIVDSTYAQKGPRGIIHVFMSGPQAQKFMVEKDKNQFVLKYVEQVYGDMKGNYQVEHSYIKCWDDDPWAKGAYPCFKPGQITSLMPDMVRPEGCVHFAGEHTSAWGGWMEGALESGHRAANEVMQAA